MAEGVVFGVLCKIGSVLASSASITIAARFDARLKIINDIESRIKQIEVELKLMQAFLRQAQSQEGYSDPTEVYLQEVRKVAFEIEDIIDEFLYLSVQQKSRFVNWELLSYFSKLGKTSWYKIAGELKDLQCRLQNLRNLRVQYEIQLPNGSRVSTDAGDHRLPQHLSYPADEMVGVEQERTMIIQWLNARTSLASVITVWGMGGSGKTTLVNSIYEDERIKNQFDCHIWITVSQKFNSYDIIRKVVRHVLKDACPSNIGSIDGRDLMEILQRTLQHRKFMLVLDDVWSTDVWMDLAGTVGSSSNANGNKVIITTRIKEVACLASGCQVLEMQKLNEANSWHLFCRWAFKNHMDRACPLEMEPLGREFVGKCDGLPLAIVVVGNMLSFKKQDMEEWRKCNDQLSWELHERLHGRELSSVTKILKLSYKHLPSHLKNAFMFCSIFPEDYKITKKRLVRLWVAEGLIKQEKRRTIEEVAEEYLHELIDRCLLHVVERKHFRKVKEFQMHDIVRELAISISEQETFCMTHNKSQPGEPEYRCRRLSIHEHNDRINLVPDASRLRSIYQFDVTCSCLPSMGTPGARYLNVLELQDVPITVLPEDLSSLFNLHYLGLRRTKIKLLPRSIEKLFNLQTLDIYLTNVEKLPTGITKLRRLRHLLAGKALAARFFGAVEMSRGVETPKGVWESMELQTLKGVLASMDLVEQLGNMTQLRTLVIEDVTDEHYPIFFASVNKMRFLRTLKVLAAKGTQGINFEALNAPPQNLRKLWLNGRLHQSVIESSFVHTVGDKLEELCLVGSKMNIDPFVSISCLSNLKVLHIDDAYDGESMIFPSGWFPKLHTLTMLSFSNIKSMVIEQETMQNLQWLALINFPALKEVPRGIEFLVSLQNIFLVGMHDEFMERIQGEEKARVQHISTVRYLDRSRGMEIRLFQEP